MGRRDQRASDEDASTGGSLPVLESGLRTHQAAPAPVETLPPGTEIDGRYRIGRRIGRGGMGAVYEAEQTAIGRSVAVKVVRPDLARDPSIVERFRREARAASRIASPHVIVVHDFGGGDQGRPLYLVMELLDGETLEARVAREGALEPREAVHIARQVATALVAAHEAGVVHRDLKPANVLLVRGQPLKVLDFGIASIATASDTGPGGEEKLTQVGALLGTPAYMSPEGCLRQAVGAPADLYALGVMLWKMLVGRLPFDEVEPVLVMGWHIRAVPLRLREARPNLVVPDALESLVGLLLAKRPEQRPPSARAVLDALDALEWTAAGPAVALPDGEATTIGGGAPAPTRRRRILVLAAAGAALALAVAFTWLVVVAMGQRDDRAGQPPSPGMRASAVSEPAAPPAAHLPGVWAPETVRLTIDVVPDAAVVRWDGLPTVERVLSVPRDGTTHLLEASAPGHQPGSLMVVADADRNVELVLGPEPGPVKARPSVTKRESTAGHVSPSRSPVRRSEPARPPSPGRVRIAPWR